MSLNAIEAICQQYRQELHELLRNHQLEEDAIREILESMQIDSGLYLTLNPRYLLSDQPFANFVHQYQLPERLISLFPRVEYLYKHQERGVLSILEGKHTIVSTGTGSGKTETFLIPIIAHALQSESQGVKAIIIYPMNALAGDQVNRIGRYTAGTGLTFALYTSATPKWERDVKDRDKFSSNQLLSREAIQNNPPDILITNYVMLDRMLTREQDQYIFSTSALSMRYLVLDELHTYMGSKATHLKYLLARLKHYFVGEIVHVGTSATLANSTEGEAKLSRFLNDLFEIEAYEFVQALVEDYPQSQGEVPCDLTDAQLSEMQFTPGRDAEAAQQMRILMRREIDDFDFFASGNAFNETSTFKAVNTHPFVVKIRDSLKEGAQSLENLAQSLGGMVENVSPRLLLQKLLEAIEYLNVTAGREGKPLLDFRIHLLVQNLTGELLCCPVCRRCYSGDHSRCQSDGYVLFPMYRPDPRYCVGKFSGQRLSAVVQRESSDAANVHYVLIAQKSDLLDERFEITGELNYDSVFRPSSQGNYALAMLDAKDYEALKDDLVVLSDERRDYQSLAKLVKLVLKQYRKSIGFVDNREKTSRYSSILRDEFADEFLIEFLKLFYPSRLPNPISTLEYLEKQAGAVASSTLENAIFEEMPLWYYRYIGIPERLGGTKDLFILKDFEGLPPVETALLNIFIRERAIKTSYYDDMPDSHFIRFQKFWATGHYGIYIEDTASVSPDYRGIALNERSQEYAAFVEQWTELAILTTAHRLVEHGILVCEQTPDEKQIYYLNPEHLCFNLSASKYGEGEDGYERMRKELLFAVESHSSDSSFQDRQRVEQGLKDGSIHFVTATPTLEMGIDIGDLQSVMMIGAPPSPSNYVQRAGRAGRGANRDAAIITFCSGDNVHDRYVFRNPTKMLNGEITPPSFNPYNPDLVKKHINAFVLCNYLTSHQRLCHFLESAEVFYRDQIPAMQKCFGDWFPYEDYLFELKATVERVVRETERVNGSLANYCYNNGIFPDYNFRRDQVIAVDISKRAETQERQNWTDYALAVRDREQALRFFVPGKVMYLAGDIYRTLEDGIYSLLSDGAREYECFYAEKEVRFARFQKEILKIDIDNGFEAHEINYEDKRGVLALGYTQHCSITLRNRGIVRYGETEKKTPFGYNLERQAVILRFDARVTSEVLRMSLVAALLREISRRYQLGDSEILLLLDATLPGDEANAYTLFYDGDGNNNLPLDRICREFNEILSSAYQKLSTCSCNDGCYDCIKSYSTQWIDGALSKSHALLVIGYLLGERRFVPEVIPYVSPRTQFDLKLNVRYHNNAICVTSSSGREYIQSVNGDLNTVIFITLSQAVEGEYVDGMRSVLVETWVDWLAECINKRSVKKGRDAFNHLQYSLLKFQHVEAAR